MSTLKVDTIQKADGTGSLSVPAESGTVVTTASPSLGRRNLIINGAMQVAQRGTSFTGLTNGSNQYTLDRWAWNEGGSSSFVTTVTQDSDSPSGFGNSYKVQTTTADDLGNTTEYLRIRQRIEAQNLQHLNYGTSDAQQITLSFWVKSSLSGVGAVNFHSVDATRMNTQNYTINAADTWEYKTIIVSGDAGGSGIVNDNGDGIILNWFLSAGAGSSVTATGNWETYNSTKIASGQTLDVVGTVNATWQITGVQLEVGSVATPFEHRSFGEELALCQRYYFRIDEGNGTPSTSTRLPAIFTNETSSRCLTAHYPPVELRATPSLSYSSLSHFTVIGTGTATNAGLGGSATNRTLYYFFDHGSSTTQYETRQISVNTSSGGWLAFDAEL